MEKQIFHVLDKIEQAGYEAYLVGGYVRDHLLKIKTSDIDICTNALPMDICKIFENYAFTTTNYGNVSLNINNLQIEITTYRKDFYKDSRRPKEVVYVSSLEEDLVRRDFTINALAVCLNKARFGELVDPFGGMEDMKEKTIRTPLDPDITFSDDPLRMMRCIRFATQLNFYIDDDTFESLCRNRERINIISRERIADELNKIILSPVPSKGFIDLERSGLLSLIFPELAALQGVETRNGRSHKDNFYHTLEVLDNISKKTDNLWLRWAALLHDIAKPATKRWEPKAGWTFHNHNFIGEKMVPNIFRKMKLPMNEKMKYVQKMVSLHMRPIVIADDVVTDSAVRRLLFEAGDDIDDLMTLCEADITSKNMERKQRFLNNFQLVRQKLKDLEEKDRIRNFQPPVSGEEIMETFGLQPCREVGALKSAIKDAILDGVIPNEYEAAHAFMLERAAKMGLKPLD